MSIDADLRKILETDSYLIVLDTNVLLNVYRYSPQFTEFALDCIQSIRKWIVLPSTVRLEYGRHCRSEFSKMERRIMNAEENTQKQIGLAQKKVLASCNNFERLCFPDVPELKEAIANGFNTLVEGVTDFFEQRRGLQLISHAWAGKDLLMDFVSELDDAGKIMPALSQETLYQWCEEGEKRYKKEIPPGFKDEKDKDGIRKYSDFILWKETLQYAKSNKKNIIFVTDDTKADWWEISDTGRQFHSKLVNEFQKTGMQIKAFVSSDFYQQVSAAFGVEKPDAVDIALRMTDDEYCDNISDRVFDSVARDLMYYGVDFINKDVDMGSEGIDELDIVESEFQGAERVGREDELIIYKFIFSVTLEGTSYDYWGRDDDTKEIITSPGIDHTFEGIIEIEVTRAADIFLDFEDDNEFESAEIIKGCLDETRHIDHSLEDYEQELGEYGLCPDCGCLLSEENLGGGGFCINCAPNH